VQDVKRAVDESFPEEHPPERGERGELAAG
jgi:hypothetical protein